MNIRNTLSKVGFSQNEITVYLKLLELGSSKAGKVAKQSKLDRSSCYNTLNSLLDKGFVSYVLIGKIKYFQATGPNRIMDYLKEQQQSFKEILPELREKHRATKAEGQVRLFKGYKGIKSIFLDIVRTKKDNFVFGSEGQFSQKLPQFADQFNRMKDENGIVTKLILRKGRDEKGSPSTEYRFLSGIRKSPVVTNIYGDKIAIMVWTDEPEGIIIENEEAAKAYKSFFDFMWKKAD